MDDLFIAVEDNGTVLDDVAFNVGRKLAISREEILMNVVPIYGPLTEYQEELLNTFDWDNGNHIKYKYLEWLNTSDGILVFLPYETKNDGNKITIKQKYKFLR